MLDNCNAVQQSKCKYIRTIELASEKHDFLNKYLYRAVRGRVRPIKCLEKVNPRFYDYYTRYKEYKLSATRRNIKYELDENETIALLKMACYFCGKKGPGGIDRIRSNDGYHCANVVACCSSCNYAKGTKTAEQFIKMCHQVSNNRKISEGTQKDIRSLVTSANRDIANNL